MKNNNLNIDILSDMALLYELSLSIGQSLDLFENIENFVSVLVSRKNLTRASVWIKKSELNFSSENADTYEMLYSSAPRLTDIEELDDKSSIIQAIVNNKSFQTNSHLDDFPLYNIEKNISDGTLLFYQLGQLGFIKLYDLKKQGYTHAEVNKLHSIMEKFTVSIEASLYYNRTLYEKNERATAEQYNRLLFNTYPFPVIIYNLDSGNIIEANEAMYEYYHVNHENIRDFNVSKFIPESMLPHNRLTSADFGTSHSSRENWTYESGNLQYHKEVIGKIINYRHSYAGFVTIHDHSEQIRSIREKELSEKKYKHIFNSMIDAYAEVDFYTGKILEISPSIKNFSGYDRQELIGKSMSDFYLNKDKDKESFLKHLKINNGKLIDYEVTLINKSGTPVICSFSVSIIYDEKGKPLKTVGTMRDITERKNTEIALMDAEKRWRALVNNSPDSILAIKTNGTILFQNAKSSQEKEAIIGKSIYSIMPEQQSERYRECISQLTETDQPTSREIVGMDDRWTLSRFVPVHGTKGIEFIMIIASDITEQKDLEMKLKSAMKEAETANQAKSRFLANMSHEIRNPMSAIIGNAELLTKTPLDENQDKMLHNLMLSADNLLGLIDNVLDLSKIEAHQLILEKTHFNLIHEVSNIIETLKARAELKDIILTLELSSSMPEYVYADRLRINQILLNILDNALKYTEKGTVSLECQFIEEIGNELKLDFTIRDSGEGIEISQLDTLFETYMNEHTHGQLVKKGAGLGLPIVKQLIELMHGEIRVESVKYFGTIVHFTILVGKGNEQLMVKSNHKNRQSSSLLVGRTILFVEDDIFNQELGEKIIKNWGGDVLIAENGFKAIEVVSEFSDSIDLIFMDLRMPIMDGIEATKMIRKSLNWKKPIIALTGEALKEKIDECYSAGMDDYISKPFKQATIENKILKFLFPELLSHGNEVIEEQPKEINKNQTTKIEEEYSTEILMEMVGDDPNELNAILNTFVNQSTANLNALAMAFNNKDWDQLQTQAHTIKTSFKYINYKQNAQVCEKLEKLASAKKENSEMGSLVNTIEFAVNCAIKQIKEDIE